MSDPKPNELIEKIDYNSPQKGWMDVPVNIRKGMYCYASNPKSVEYVHLPHARAWNPLEEDWKLPDNWKEIVHNAFRERLDRFRSFKVFMDICVRCGACADKCHFFIGTGDPKNMPVLRAELLRSVYRNDFTAAGKILGKVAGARELTLDVLKEWWYYFFQCTECRRCSVFCPYGIDTAEITIMAREIFNLLGLNIDWIATPVANCYRTGNHLGIQPQEIEYFPCHYCYFGRIYAIRTKNGAAPAFGALKEIVPPFFQHIQSKLTRSCDLPENFSGRSKIIPVYRAEKFGP